jgi:putative MATE family efflux protein
MQLDMTKGKPLPLIAKFMIPVVFGKIFQQFYNIADTIIVGRFVGLDALAAVGATGSVVFLIFGFAMGLTTGFTVITAQRFGAGDEEGMKKSIASAICLALCAVVFLTLVSLLGMRSLLRLMHTPENIFEVSAGYLRVLYSGMLFTVLYNLLAAILRAVGNSVMPLVLLIISSITNIVLDLTFILAFHMGVQGAAYATVISQALSVVLCVFYIWRKVPLLHVTKEHFKLQYTTVQNQLTIGVPMALQFSITALGTIAVQSALNRLGTLAVASYAVSGKIEQLVTQPFSALGVTVATFSAQNRGVNDIKRIREGVKIANIINVIYSLLVYGLIILLLPVLVRLFLTEGDFEQVYKYSQTYNLISGACFTALGIIFIFRNALQGCGYGFLPMLGGVLELVIRVVVATLAARAMSFSAVCLANCSTWIITGIFLWILYHFLIRKLARSVALSSSV